MDLLRPRYTTQDLEILDQRRSLANVARAIIDARVELGLSQEELGQRAGTKQSRVSEIEAMKGNPRLDTLDRIARVLGKAVDLVDRWPAAHLLPEGYVSYGKVTSVTQASESKPMDPVMPVRRVVWQTKAIHG
jgi:transcriptional regulator with XRE-family HTH domain